MNSKMKKITTQAGTLFISVVLLNACGVKKEVEIHPENITTDEVEEKIDDKTIDLEDKVLLVTFDDYREVKNNIYTYQDLNHINSLVIRIDDDFDYSFINDLSNLEFLHLDDHSNGKSLNVLDGSKIKKLTSVAITMDPKVGEFSEERYGFLKDMKSINNLILGEETKPLAIDNDYLEELKNVHSLYISVNKNSNIDYDDLDYLDFLYLDGDTDYINRKEIRELKEDGVKVHIKK